MGLSGRRVTMVLLLATTAWLAGCGSSTVNRAPIEERMPGVGSSAPAPVVPAVQQPPGFENAGKAGYYTVKPGDTMIRIGLENGQSWRDIARWNNLVNANVIEVGQVLRVTPPLAAPVVAGAGAAPRTGAVPPVVPVTPAASAAAPGQHNGAVTIAAVPAASVVVTPVSAAPGTSAAVPADEEVALIWSATGALLAGFDEVKNKGVDIGGAAGDPVLAAGDGRVVYVGASLRGYGNLIILKHNNTYLTAYAHNQALLVKEDQTVRKGQKIAEMGNSDADRVKLHFEVRRQGKPVDPAKYLPPR